MEFLSDLKSDYGRIKHLLETEKMDNIEFMEKEDHNDNDDLVGDDTYAKIQEEGNKRAEALSDALPEEYNVDEMRNDGSRRYRSIGFDFRSERENRQFTGGQNDDKLDSYEKDFFEIFNKAKEYRRRIMDAQNRMDGGQNSEHKPEYEKVEEKKAKPLGETMKLTMDVSRKIKDSNKYPEIQWKYLMQVSKLIIDDAKKMVGSKEVNNDVREKALELANNPQEYVAKWRERSTQAKEQKEIRHGEAK